MRILSVVFLSALAAASIPVIALHRYPRRLPEELLTGREPFRFLYPMALWLTDHWYEKKGGGKQERWARAVYVRDMPEEKLRLRCAKRIVKLWMFFMAALIFGLVLSIMPAGETSVEEGFLKRPAFGETKVYELEVEGIEETAVEVAVPVSGRLPGEEEMQAVFDRVIETVKEEILGDNESLEEVRSDLDLISATDYGIRVEWDSLNPEWISSRGRLVSDQVPADGVLVTLRATLSYAAYQAYYDIFVCLKPQEKTKEYYLGLLTKELEEAEKNSREEEFFRLPEKLDGKLLAYSGKQSSPPWSIIFLLPLIGALAAAADWQNLKKEYEERNSQMNRDYSSLVFKLSLMLNCGMTLRGAWSRIVESYLDRKEESGRRYVYEEMIMTQNEMNAGDGEAAAYRAFGMRCEGECYLRFSGYLDQNLKQGVSGMQAILETEMVQALEERKHMALRMGEAMNTKLLLPMFLMLGVVVAVLITPALLSM